MKTFFSVIRHLVTLPSDLVGWLMVLVIHAMWGRRLFWYKGALFTVLKEDSWPRNPGKRGGGWYQKWAGTTFTSNAIMLSESGMNTKVVEHELQHSRQMVVSSFAFLIAAIVVAIWAWWVALPMWALGSLLISAANFFESWSNGGDAYRDNIQEQHARAASKAAPYQMMEDILDKKVEPLDWTPEV